MAPRRLMSFDWAIKRVLRSKANFAVLEGFLSVLLGEDVTIVEILESESNKDSAHDKFNRIDMKARLSGREVVIIEVQNENEYDFFQRLLYSASKTLCEHIHESDNYTEVVKVISVNIVHFKLGEGDDYVYRGFTHFCGIHTDTPLKLTKRQEKLFSKKLPGDIMPEYYIIEVEGFDGIAKTPLDEWIYFLKNEKIEDGFTAQGLKEAQKALDILKLPPEDRLAYDNFVDWRRSSRAKYETALHEGLAKGRAEGRAEGKRENQVEIAKKLIQKGLPAEEVAEITGLSEEELDGILA